MVGNSAGKARSNSRRRLFLILAVLVCASLIVTSDLGFPSRVQHQSKTNAIKSPPIDQIFSHLSYDEQVAITFGDSFPSLAFNVTAVPQTDPSTGVGPAYLLNGVTDTDYWYQVGLSYKWPLPNGTAAGFNMAYEVFEPCPSYYPNCNGCNGSIFPANCAIGLDNLLVRPGDIVQLSLGFSGNSVEMRAMDWNTTSTHSETYSSEGASHQFLGLASPANGNGFFTGLMTEQYFASPYYGSGQPVTYRQSGLDISSGTMWMEEFVPNTYPPIFSAQTPSPVSFTNTVLLQYFSSNGTAEAANSHEFITGLTPIIFPSIAIQTPTVGSQGQQASIGVNVQDPSGLVVEITSLGVTSGFGVYNNTSSAPSGVTGSATFITKITIPSNLPVGNYTLSIVIKLQVRYSQIPDWIAAQTIFANSTIRVNKASPPQATTPPPTTRPPIIPPLPGQTPASSSTTGLSLLSLAREILLPSLVAEIVVAVAALAIVFHRRNRASKTHPSQPTLCSSCSRSVTQNMIYCPACGITLRGSTNLPSPETEDETGKPSS